MLIFSRLYYWLRRKARDFRAGLVPESVREQQALVTWPRRESNRLFYVFQGRRMRLLMEPLTFFRATGLIDVNLVMLRDYKQFFYHAGLNSELTDVDAIRERLFQCRQQMPHVTQTFCLGSSMGGYAGILFGHYLKVDTVYAFSPQTLIDLPLLEKTMGRKEGWRFPDAHRDLTILLADYNGKTRYKIFYCEGSPRDRDWAERISRCPGVELCPQPGDSHQVVEEMHKQGLLAQVLRTKD